MRFTSEIQARDLAQDYWNRAHRMLARDHVVRLKAIEQARDFLQRAKELVTKPLAWLNEYESRYDI